MEGDPAVTYYAWVSGEDEVPSKPRVIEVTWHVPTNDIPGLLDTFGYWEGYVHEIGEHYYEFSMSNGSPVRTGLMELTATWSMDPGTPAMDLNVDEVAIPLVGLDFEPGSEPDNPNMIGNNRNLMRSPFHRIKLKEPANAMVDRPTLVQLPTANITQLQSWRNLPLPSDFLDSY